MALSDTPRRLWNFAKKIDELFQLQRKTNEAVDGVERRLKELEDRMTRLEANQGQVITEARAAASAASTAVAGGILSEAVTRLTRLEMRTERLLSPPENSD